MRYETFFIILLLSFVCIASGVGAETANPQLATAIPTNGHINASEKLSQISNIGYDTSCAIFALNWQNEESDLEMALRAPSGVSINQSAQMPVGYTKEKLDTYYVIPDPEPGNWTVIIEAKNVSAGGEDYVFFAAQVLGKTPV
jgi:hypothetical protein